ncbi:MAG TPA: transporter substrate-binding domain-containing protein [Candidatus Acidoferrales bacterium]|nr:transporter substrate-binding domain-containing protein [Candidatus Acidoferrales bacterium]
MKWLWSIIVFAVALSASGLAAQDAPSQARADLAPTGELRVALFPLPHIAVRDKETGQFSGVVVDLSRELAKRLGVPVEFTTANTNAAAVDQVKNDQADLTFLVSLPALAAQIDFGAAYIAYETTFLVPANSPIRSLDDVDAPGRRIIAPERSAIETKLSQTFKNVKLIGVPIAIGSANRVVEILKNGEADGYSNLTHLLSLTQTALPGWRIVPGSYMMTVFSIGYPKDRPAGALYANQFIEEMKKSGFIQQAIERANLKGAVVAR